MIFPQILIETVEDAFDRLEAASAAGDIVRIGVEAPQVLRACEALVDACTAGATRPSSLLPLCLRADRLSTRLNAAAQGVAEALRQLSAPTASACVYDEHGASHSLTVDGPHVWRRY